MFSAWPLSGRSPVAGSTRAYLTDELPELSTRTRPAQPGEHAMAPDATNLAASTAAFRLLTSRERYLVRKPGEHAGKTRCRYAWMSSYSAIQTIILYMCSSGITTGFTRRRGSSRPWRERSAARGWYSTTRWPPGGTRTRPGGHTPPTGSCQPG